MKITYSNNEFHSENGALLGWLLPDMKTELKQGILSAIGKVLERHGHSLEVKEITVGDKVPSLKGFRAYHSSVTAGIDNDEWRWITFYVKWENKMPCIKSVVKACEKVLRSKQ